MNEKTRACQKCGRLNSLDRAACLYCGTSFDPAAVSPSSQASPQVQKVSPSPVDLQKQAKALAESRSHRCPNCNREEERVPIKVEFWKFKRYSIWGRRRYFDVLATSVPGYCRECSEALRWKRFKASFLLSAPIWLIMGIAFTGALGFSAVMTVFYFGWILRGCRYSWTDGSVYGDELQNNLRVELSTIEHPPGARIEFPIGGIQTFIRAVLIPATPFLLILLLSAGVGIGHLFTRKEVSPEGAPAVAKSQGSEGFQQIGAAFLEKNESLVTELLNKHPEVVREKDEHGRTALHFAVKANNAKIITEVLDKGADIEAKDNSQQATPLHFAVLGSYYISTKALLARGADINAKMKDGATPLMLASLFPDPGLAKVLLEHGARVNEKQNDGESPLSFAKSHHRKELEKMLREAGATEE